MSFFIYELFSKAFDVLKILKYPKLLIWLVLTSALLLFIPVSIIPYPEYHNFKKQYSIWAWLILIGSISMLAIEAVIYLYKYIKRTLNYNRFRDRIKNRLETLNENEKAILREFFIQGRNHIKLPTENVDVVSLREDKIIELIKLTMERYYGNSLGFFSITTIAKEFITQELLGFPQEGPTSENIEKILRERPYFAIEIEYKDRLWNS